MVFADTGFAGWDPFREFERMLDDVNRAVTRGRFSGAEPALNVWADDSAVVLTAAVPGLDPESIEVTTVGDTVTISGRRAADEHAGATWLRRERGELTFTRSVQLPFPVDADRTEARYRAGVLYVALRRPDEQKPKKITVQAA